MAPCLAILFVLFALLPTSYAHGNTEMTTTYKDHQLTIGKVDVEWKYNNDSDTLRFKVVGPTTGWLAFGFSYKKEGMQNFDIALGGVRGGNESYLYDLYSTTESKPPLDSKKNFFLINANEIDGKTTLEFSRKRQTGDAKDHQFEPGRPVYFMWAYHPTKDASNGNTFDYHGSHRAHTEKTYDVLSGGFMPVPTLEAFIATCIVTFRLVN